jgi:O-antigen/teichoic acid export membrane protein
MEAVLSLLFAVMRLTTLLVKYSQFIKCVFMEPSIDVLKTTRGFINLVVQSLINAFLGLLFFIVLARLITKSEMGVLAVLGFTYGLLQTVGCFRLNTAAARFVPKFLGEGDVDKASAAAKGMIQIVMVFSIVLCALYYWLASYFSLFLIGSTAYVDLFRITTFLILATAPSFIMDGLHKAVHDEESLITRVRGSGTLTL